jgi:transcriptional regulator with XRE-family HTH domain
MILKYAPTHPALPFGHVTLSAKKPQSRAYPKALTTIGDHMRTRRLDLNLLQKDVALSIGVDTCTITNWEKDRSSPRLHLMPKIIAFLGDNPFSVDEGGELGEKIRVYRKLHGITQKRLAKELGIDPTTLARWEKDLSTRKESDRKRLWLGYSQ